jgi:hypothetical protein
MNTPDTMLDHRARLERARLDAEQLRQRSLAGQRDPMNTPAERVRIWERLHQVRLPRDPAHAILAAVARETELDLGAVLEVQRERLQA